MTRKILIAGALLAAASPVLANNIIAADHPPFGDKGYVLQFDNRVISQSAAVFVDRAGKESGSRSSLRSNLLIARVFVPGWLFRVSLPYTRSETAAARRSALGDIVTEAGLSDEWKGWYYRALLYANIPGAYDPARLNVGSGAWSLGPNASFTRYFSEKKYNVSAWAQYAVNFTNPYTQVKAGNSFSYAVAGAVQLDAGVPLQAGIEQRGLLADPNTRDGSAFGYDSRRELSVGPVLMINLKKLLPGFTLWPTAQYDFYNRNTARLNLYYLKLQYSW